jgi:hypothetical protein
LSDIFDEVEQELRADRARQLLQRYGGVLIAAAVAVVVAVGGWQAWQAWQARQRAQVATLYLDASQAADSPDSGTREVAVPVLRQVIARGDEGYRSLARLRLAAVLAPTDPKAALALWDRVAGDPAADPLLRETATLSWALHLIDTGDPGMVGARLAALARPEDPLHALAEEAQALLDLRLGKVADAKAKLTSLMNDATAPQGVRGRATGLLMQLGGS